MWIWILYIPLLLGVYMVRGTTSSGSGYICGLVGHPDSHSSGVLYLQNDLLFILTTDY